MSSTVLIGVLLGLLASLLFNASYLVQHKALDGGPEIAFASAPLKSLRELLTHPVWLLGGLLGVIGMGSYILALDYAPLSLVQAFLAGGLIFTVPMAMLIGGHRPVARETAGAALMTVALVMFAFGTKAEGPTNHYDAHGLGILVAAASAIGIMLAWRGVSTGQVELVGLAAGLFYGASDALFNALVGILHGGLIALLESPWLWICILVAIAAFVSLQRAFKDGQEKPVGVIALMTAATNITAIGAGFLVFHDPLGTTLTWEVIHSVCFALVVTAGWMLASAQAAVEQGATE